MGYQNINGVAIIDIEGEVIAKAISRQLDVAVSDKSIKTVLLKINSRGGSLRGIPKLALDLFRARKSKKIIAFIDQFGLSAAYWISSQAHEVHISPNGQTAGIGVKKECGKHTFVSSASPFKAEASPGGMGAARFQKTVDSLFEYWVADVAKGRFTTVAHVKSCYGQGKILQAEEAIKVGAVDRILSHEGLMKRLALAV